MADVLDAADDQVLAQEPIADEAQPGADSDPTADVSTDEGLDAQGQAGASAPDVDLDALLADEGVRSRLFEHETVAEKFRERENAGAQRREAQLKREAGTQENTRRNVAALFQAVGLDPAEPIVDAEGRNLMPRADYLYALAQANAAVEITKVIPDVMLKDFAIPAEVREQALEMRADGRPADEWLTHLVHGAADARVAELRKGDEAKNTAEVNKRLAAEMKARGLEAAPKTPGAPPIPSGSAGTGGITPQELDAMPTATFLAKSPEERARLVEEARANAGRTAAVAR